MQPENNNKFTNQSQLGNLSTNNPINTQKTFNKMQLRQGGQGKWKNIGNYQGNNNQTGNNFVIFNRSGHCSFIYKNYLYFYGGFQISIKNQSNKLAQNQKQSLNILKKESLWNSFHKFNINNKQFSRQPINYGSNSNLFTNICNFGYLLLGSCLYIYGGMNYQTGYRRNPQMFSINLESGSVKRYQSKTPQTLIPSPRLNPIIAAIQKTVLMVMGGQVCGNSTFGNNFLNDMYIFKIQTKTWTKIQDSYHIKFSVLNKPALINFGDNCIYMLGGKRTVLRNNGNIFQQLNNSQIFRLRVINKTINSKSDCCVKKVFSTNNIPQNHTYLKILKYFQKGIIVATKDLNYLTNKKIYFWYFDPLTLIWCEIPQKLQQNQSFVYNEIIQDIVVATQKIIIAQKNGIIRELTFNHTTIQNLIKQISINSNKINFCTNCQQQKMFGTLQKNLIPAQYLQQFANPLEFPYTAIGLLVDNAVYSSAKNCNIMFNVGSIGKQSVSQNNKNVYMIIQDNGSPSNLWASQMKPLQYVNAITSFNATILLQDIMIEQDNKKMFNKSIKQIDQKQKNLQKQFNNFLKNQNKPNTNQTNQNNLNSHFKNEKDFQKQQHQYIERKQKIQYKKKLLEIQQKCKKLCNNIKLAGIRLGDTIVYACKQKKNQQNNQHNIVDKDIRRYFFMRKQKCQVTGKFYFVSYAYVTQNGNAADPKMQSTIKQCTKQFKKQLKIITQRFKTMNTVILISDLKNFPNSQDNSQKNLQKQMVSQKQLRLKKKQNDVFYGQSSMLTYLQANSLVKMSENCDISLKTYLGLLYLNNDQLDIYISVRQNQLEQINSQPFLNTIDKMLNSKKIIEVSKSLDFSDECSVVQVYWNPDHNSNNDNIANKINSLGFLLNGILIYHRNRLISRYGIELGKFLDSFQINNKYGSTFGYLQIKPQYGANLYSTDTLYPRLFQKYYSRIQFVSEYMETKYRQKRTRTKDDLGAGNYQKISKRTKFQ